MRFTLTFLLFWLCSGIYVWAETGSEFEPQFEPQSREAWHYATAQGKRHISHIYEQTSEGLICKQTRESQTRDLLENLAAEHSVHPALIAEEISVYLWNDWSAFYVSGYDLESFIAAPQSADDLGSLLDTFYLEHYPCLAAIVRVLVAGYEGHYVQGEEGYQYNRAAESERYKLYALEPKYFPGTGLFEPLGIVYLSRYANLLSITPIRKYVITHFARIIEKRGAEGNPLKVTK